MDFIETSVLVASIVASEPHHADCARLLDQGGLGLYAHGLVETFSVLTGGRKPFRLSPKQALEMVETDYLPCLRVTVLSATETLRAMRDCHSRGVQGGAIFDYLHLAAARKAQADRIYTLNASHFRAFHRAGDPEIVRP